MKKIILFIAFSGIIYLTNAQTTTADKFIEVKVSDTIKVSPDYIEAFVKIKENNESTYDYSYDEKDNNDAKYSEQAAALIQEKKKKEIEKKIAEISNTYNFSESTGGGLFGKEMDIYTGGYVVVLKNMSDYDRLVTSLNDMDDVNVMIKTMEIRNQEMYNTKLMEKTMNTALKEATSIAKIMNVTIDKPIAVRNFDGNSINYGDMFGGANASSNYLTGLFSMMGSMFKSATKENYVVLSKTLVVKYIYH